MEAILLSSSPEPQNPITDPANSMANHQSEEEFKDETMMKKKTKPSNLEKRKLKGKKKERMNNDEASSSSCSSSFTSNSNSTRRVSRVAHRLRNPTVWLGMARRSVGERQAEALALPLGMSFAAFANLNAEAKCHDEVTLSACSDLERTMVNVNGGMTEYGLFCLKEAIANHEVCVLVHNNTFRTATKYEDEVYLLVTNKGLINGGMFWEKLNSSEERGAEAFDWEGDNNEAEDIEEEVEAFDWEEDYYGAQDMGGAEAFDWEGDNNGAEDIEGAEEFDSEDSMETHVGGKASPKSVLEVQSSSSSTDDSSLIEIPSFL